MNRGWYIKSTGEKVILKTDHRIDLINMDIVELFITNGVTHVECRDNNLTKLDLPDSVQFINCRNNRLTELIIPDDCKVLCDPDVRVITRTMFNRSNRLKNLLK